MNEYGGDQIDVSVEVYKPIKFVRVPKDMVANSLEVVTIECAFETDPRLGEMTRVSWKKGNTSLDVASDKYKVSEAGSLMLKEVMKTDQGVYTCVVSNDLQTANQTTRLTVLGEPPSFLSTEKDVRALESTNVTLSCQANALPIPKIEWFMQDGEAVPLEGRFSQALLGDLTVSNLRLDDQGDYLCRASNVYGQIETVSTLEVIKKSNVGRDGVSREIVKLSRQDVVLECGVSYDPRLHLETQVKWEKDGRRLFFSEDLNPRFTLQSDRALSIRNLSLSDRGVYACLVSTPFETSSSEVLLRVSGEPPKILSSFDKVVVYEGERLELKCLVRGVPRPTMSWLFDGDRMEGSSSVVELETASPEFRESSVVVEAVSKKHEGVYQCETSNVYGSGVAKFSKVQVITRTTVGIMKSSDNKILSIHAGKRLRIPCHFSNDPLNRVTNIEWSKDDEPIAIGPKDKIDFGMDGSIIINDVQRRHQGDYRCTVVTMLDNATDVVSIEVVVNAPVIVKHSAEEQIAFEGDRVKMVCRANGIPEPRVSWSFNKTKIVVGRGTGGGRPAGDTSVMSIDNVIVSDSGLYVCLARNEYGQTRQRMRLSVVPMPKMRREYEAKVGDRVELPCATESDSELNAQYVFRSSIGLSISNFQPSAFGGKRTDSQ